MKKDIRPAPSSDLWDLVLDMNWPGVILHAKEEPQDANFVEGHWHETPLYLACQHNAPLEAIRAIIKAHPESVAIANTENRDLPLHIACRYQADSEILQALLEGHPKTATEPTKWGYTPIVTLLNFRTREKNNIVPDQLEDDNDFWKKVFILLEATSRSLSTTNDQHYGSSYDNESKDSSSDSSSNDGEKENIFFVHAAVSLGTHGCPIEVLSYVVQKYPKQIFLRDTRGKLPLHIAIDKPLRKGKKRTLKHNETTFVSFLLDAYSGGAQEKVFDDHQRYPLHSAILNGHMWSQGIQELFLAAPEIALVQDPVTGLFPFQLAALSVTPENTNAMDSFETIYQLLIARPDVIDSIQQIQNNRKKSKPMSSPKTLVPRALLQMVWTTTFAKRMFGVVTIASCARFFFDLIGTVSWDICSCEWMRKGVLLLSKGNIVDRNT